jgi:hypothetical protein
MIKAKRNPDLNPLERILLSIQFCHTKLSYVYRPTYDIIWYPAIKNKIDDIQQPDTLDFQMCQAPFSYK